MSTTDPTVASDRITLSLTADEANAVVMAIALAVTGEAHDLSTSDVSALPGNLSRIGARCRRIAGLADVAEQLLWRAHFGRHGGQPPEATTTEAVLLDLAAALQERAAERRRFPEEDEFDGPFQYDRAARTLARTFADHVAEASA